MKRGNAELMFLDDALLVLGAILLGLGEWLWGFVLIGIGFGLHYLAGG